MAKVLASLLIGMALFSSTAMASDWRLACGKLLTAEQCALDVPGQPNGPCLVGEMSPGQEYFYFLSARSANQRDNLASMRPGYFYCVEGAPYFCGRGGQFMCVTVGSVIGK